MWNYGFLSPIVIVAEPWKINKWDETVQVDSNLEGAIFSHHIFSEVES